MDIFQNDPLMAALIAWFIAQFSKIIIHFIKTKQLDLMKFFSSGGMPSSHSSTVTALALAVGLKDGMDSTIFAVAVIIAVIIMYDASGVRLAVSKHAKFLNDFFHGKVKDYKFFNELVGHTSLEVVMGAIVGIITALLYV